MITKVIRKKNHTNNYMLPYLFPEEGRKKYLFFKKWLQASPLSNLNCLKTRKVLYTDLDRILKMYW